MRSCIACGAHTDENPCPYCHAPSAPRGQEPATVESHVLHDTLAPGPTPQLPREPNPPGPAYVPRRPAAPNRAKVIVGAVIVAALGGAAVYAFGDLADSSPGGDVRAVAPISTIAPETGESSPSAPTDSQTPPETTTPTPTETVLTEEEERSIALTTLDDMVLADRARQPVRGQWVAQLASKFEGVVDTSRQPEPFTIPQILDEVVAHRSNPEYGELVRVILQGDWGKSEPGPKTLWVTVADLDFDSRETALAWCGDHFSQRGEDLLNVCYPRQLHLR